MTLDEHRPTQAERNAAAIDLLDSWLHDPDVDEHEQARQLDDLIRSLHRSTHMPDTIGQSLIYGRLAATVLSTLSAGTIVIENVEPIISATLALLAAVAALTSKLREARK